MLTFKQKLAKNYINAVGWRTKRKLLIIESDDWGSIRMPSREDYDFFLKRGIEVDKNYFDKYDSVESSEDLEFLFNTLNSVQDFKGNPAVITAYSVVANPNFDLIEKNGRSEFVYELIAETYKRKGKTNNSLQLIKEGIANRLFVPQFHGREHVNVKLWMNAINSDSIKEKLAFEKQAVISSQLKDDVYKYTHNVFSAFDATSPQDEELHKVIITDGLHQFEKLFGYKSISFVAPTSIWQDHINETLFQHGVRLQFGSQALVLPGNKTKIINKRWGEKNPFGQIFWRRNCTFEPSRNQNYDWVSRCMEEINIAFRWNKPAAINSHRVNFIGSIFPENRDQSLKKLEQLLKAIMKKWPDVEFTSTKELADIMISDLG